MLIKFLQNLKTFFLQIVTKREKNFIFQILL